MCRILGIEEPMPEYKQKLHAQMGQLERTSVYSTRAHILMEAATAMCRYCAGTKGHDSHPVKNFDRWEHMFYVGNGSNPCAAGPIWTMIEQCCVAMGPQYIEQCPNCLADVRDCTC